MCSDSSGEMDVAAILSDLMSVQAATPQYLSPVKRGKMWIQSPRRNQGQGPYAAGQTSEER